MSSTDNVTIWEPAQLLAPTTTTSSSPLSLIILNQPLSLRPAIYQTIFSRANHRVAADGGANRLYDLSTSISSSTTTSTNTSALTPNLIIGDLDSLLPSVRAHYSTQGIQIIHDHDQQSTDFGKAYSWLRAHATKPGQAQDIIVLGGLGGRVDQGLSVLHHLYMFQADAEYSAGKMYLLSSECVTFLLKAGRHRVRVKQDPVFALHEGDEGGSGEGRPGLRWGLGKHIGIIPMKEPSVISTKGLEWDVQDWKTEIGGSLSTSNWVRKEWVEIETSKDVLFTIDLKIEES